MDMDSRILLLHPAAAAACNCRMQQALRGQPPAAAAQVLMT